jgi:hypothetical protein
MQKSLSAMATWHPGFMQACLYVLGGHSFSYYLMLLKLNSRHEGYIISMQL